MEWRKIRIDSRMLQRIIRIGIPAGMQSVMYNISNIIIQAGVNNLGTDNVTAWATYGKVDGLYWMMINALGISVTTLVGQNYGARRMDRVRKGAGACMVIGVVLYGHCLDSAVFGDTCLLSFYLGSSGTAHQPEPDPFYGSHLYYLYHH